MIHITLSQISSLREHPLLRRIASFWRRSAFLALQLDVEPVHIASGRSAAWWAFLLLMPVHLFRTNDSFRGLSAHGREWEWGCVLLPLALLHLACLFSPRAWLQCLTLALGVFTWAFIAAFLAKVSVHIVVFGAHTPILCALWIAVNTGVGLYSGMALDCGRGLLRAGIYLIADVSLALGRRKAQRAKNVQHKNRQQGG